MKSIRPIILGLLLLALFFVFTLLVCFVDVQPIGVALSETVRRELPLLRTHADNRVKYCFSDRETSFKRFDTEHLKSLPKGSIHVIPIEQF